MTVKCPQSILMLDVTQCVWSDFLFVEKLKGVFVVFGGLVFSVLDCFSICLGDPKRGNEDTKTE